MQPTLMSHLPNTTIVNDVRLVREAARAPPPYALYLKDAASTTLDLIAAAAEQDKDKHLECLSRDAVVLIAAIWRSYLESNSPPPWPSRELGEVIVHITMMLHSAKQFVASGTKMRKSKFPVVRRFKVARDAPRMKMYRTQLATSALVALVEILKLNTHDTPTALTESIGHIRSAQLPVIYSLAERERGVMNTHAETLPGEGESTASEPSTTRRPADDQAHRKTKMGSEKQMYSGDDGTSEATPEEIFNRTFPRQWPVINMMFVSGSAVAIGGGDAHVHTHI
ncbi:hypothetical protein HYPSUDRAFT_300686 [Hypholoma sublateritium FD-334 SS-4]|uniref:Uncharacterized protein n=1 Tax=Hypholoma sublateritium (strain FD-334 SS-4) TaxID=945553 RepID=A0A0D2NAK3_HYPSF|nr:hypothetical protein HYPSUDRAFT_300686 [Hypholoma sublateritium FD-334 SS-4]